MAFFENKEQIWSRNTIGRKLLLPFILITLFLAVFSMSLSIHFISQTMDKRLIKNLETQTLIIREILQDRLNKLIFHTRLITDIREYLDRLPIIKKAVEGRELSSNILREAGTLIYWNPDQIPKEKKEAYEKMLELGRIGEERRSVFITEKDNKLNLTIAGISLMKKSKHNSPIITEIIFNSNFLTQVVRNNDEVNAAYIYLGKFQKKDREEILAATPYILESQDIQKKIMQIISKNIPSRNKKIYSSFKYNKTLYKVVFEKWNYHPNIYTANLVPYTNIFYTKIRIVIGTIVLLSLISIWILVIYALIIRNFTSSINEVSLFASEIAEGNLDKEIILQDSPKEIEKLVISLNTMVGNLKRASDTIINEKNRLDAIITNIPDGIILTDMNNCLIKANTQAEKVFNFSLNKSKGKSLLEYINNANIVLALKQGWKVGHKQISREVEIPEDKDKKVVFSLTSSFVSNSIGEKIGAVTVIRDITHQKELKELRDGFLRTVSHELKTPLTTIIGFLELFIKQAQKSLTKQQEYYIDIALKESRNLHSIINDLLDISHIKAGKMEISFCSINVYELFSELLASFSPMAKSKGLELGTQFNNKQLFISADKSKLRRIFVNLISNAIKFTSKGSINLLVDEKKDKVVFTVKDTGIGLNEDEYELVFEKFRQIDYSEERQYEGIGLGLSITKQLVKLHKGDIWVKSTYGKGSEFSFSIPK